MTNGLMRADEGALITFVKRQKLCVVTDGNPTRYKSGLYKRGLCFERVGERSPNRVVPQILSVPVCVSAGAVFCYKEFL